jgi:hypothetical protein
MHLFLNDSVLISLGKGIADHFRNAGNHQAEEERRIEKEGQKIAIAGRISTAVVPGKWSSAQLGEPLFAARCADIPPQVLSVTPLFPGVRPPCRTLLFPA